MYFFSHKDRYCRKLLRAFPSLFVMMDEEYLVPGRRCWLCSCCGSAGTACWEWQSKTKQLVARHSPVYQGVSITLAKMQGNWAFTISPVLTVVHWFWSVICLHSPALPMIMDILVLFTQIFFWEGPFGWSCRCWHAATITRHSCVYCPFLSNLWHEHKHYVVDSGACRIVFEHE